MNGTVTFDRTPAPGTINLGIGQPSADLLPVELLRQASDTFFAQAQPLDLNYGARQGDERFLQSLAKLLSRRYHAPVNADSLFVTGGNSQALDFMCTVFTERGDTVFVEEPSYFLAFQIFKDHGLNIVGIPVDDDGMDPDHLHTALSRYQPKMLYTIPSYHNPGGQCLSASRRKQLVELSMRHNFLIVADEVYQMLSYYETPPPAMGTMIDSGTVISLGSFSKILAPALRLGWIQCAPALLNKIMASGLSNSGGALNHNASHLARICIDLGLQDQHVEKLQNTLRARAAAMNQALDQYFAHQAQWVPPRGGYFYWLEFDPSRDTTALKQKAAQLQTGFQPGRVFSCNQRLQHCLRLSFAHYNEQDIETGIARLSKLF